MKVSRIIALLSFFLLFQTKGYSQLGESFSDGDFTNGIIWSGTTASWNIATSSDVAAGAVGSNTLRLNVASGSGIQYLSTRISGSWGSQQTWGFWMGRRGQAATAANMMYIWLYANEPDVTTNTVDGYRIRFGDDASTGDRIILETVTNGIGVNILSSAPVTNGITDFGILVRVIRNETGQWSLFTSALPVISGTGAIASSVPSASNTGILQATATNNSISVFDNGYIAVVAVHSTVAAARTGVEFDQLEVAFAEKSPLPVRFSDLQGMITSTGVLIEWNNLTESDISNYEVQRSSTATDFITITSVSPLRNNGGNVHYSYTDYSADDDQFFYRIKATETSGKILYSSIIRMKGNMNDLIIIYPNPVQSGGFQFSIKRIKPGKYSYILYNINGSIIQKSFFNHTGAGLNRSVQVDGLPSGLYLLEINGPEHIRKQFVVQ
jgi:hypothetical protein